MHFKPVEVYFSLSRQFHVSNEAIRTTVAYRPTRLGNEVGLFYSALESILSALSFIDIFIL